MDKLGAKLFVLFGFWLFFAQEAGIYASTAEALEVQQDAGKELRETSSSGHLGAYQIKIFELETPPEDFQVGSLPFQHFSTVIPGKKKGDFTSYDFFLRDQKYHLKTQVFPFHSYW